MAGSAFSDISLDLFLSLRSFFTFSSNSSSLVFSICISFSSSFTSSSLKTTLVVRQRWLYPFWLWIQNVNPNVHILSHRPICSFLQCILVFWSLFFLVFFSSSSFSLGILDSPLSFVLGTKTADLTSFLICTLWSLFFPLFHVLCVLLWACQFSVFWLLLEFLLLHLWFSTMILSQTDLFLLYLQEYF